MKCERCKTGEVKYAGSNLCEDCYLGSVNLANSKGDGIKHSSSFPKGKAKIVKNKVLNNQYDGS